MAVDHQMVKSGVIDCLSVCSRNWTTVVLGEGFLHWKDHTLLGLGLVS